MHNSWCRIHETPIKNHQDLPLESNIKKPLKNTFLTLPNYNKSQKHRDLTLKDDLEILLDKVMALGESKEKGIADCDHDVPILVEKIRNKITTLTNDKTFFALELSNRNEQVEQLTNERDNYVKRKIEWEHRFSEENAKVTHLTNEIERLKKFNDNTVLSYDKKLDVIYNEKKQLEEELQSRIDLEEKFESLRLDYSKSNQNLKVEISTLKFHDKMNKQVLEQYKSAIEKIEKWKNNNHELLDRRLPQVRALEEILQEYRKGKA